MASSYSVSRDYARGSSFSRGSRLANSLYQGDPGPSLFAPGAQSRTAAFVKLAHAILAYGSQKRAQQLNEQLAQQAREKSDLEMSLLRQKADPNYESAYQRESLQLQRDRLNADKKATPRAPVHLGADQAKALGLGGEGDYDPEAVGTATTLRGQDITRRGQDMVNTRVTKITNENKDRNQKLAAARLALRQIDESRKRASDAAEDVARTNLARWRQEVLNPHTSRVRRAALLSDSLLTAPNFDVKTKPIPGDVDARIISMARRQAEQQHDQQFGPERDRWNRVIDELGGISDSTSTLSPAMQGLIEAGQAWKPANAAPR